MGCGHVTGCRPWDVMGFGGNSWDASQGPGCFNQNRKLYRNGSWLVEVQPPSFRKSSFTEAGSWFHEKLNDRTKVKGTVDQNSSTLLPGFFPPQIVPVSRHQLGKLVGKRGKKVKNAHLPAVWYSRLWRPSLCWLECFLKILLLPPPPDPFPHLTVR